MKTLKSKPQPAICWTSACAILLLHIQNASHRICPAFYYERRVSHNERLLAILSQKENEREESLFLALKELFIYNHFSKQNPQTVIDWNKTAIEGELKFQENGSSLVCEMTEQLFAFVTTPRTEEYALIHNLLITINELHLLELFKQIAIQVNYLKD